MLVCGCHHSPVPLGVLWLGRTEAVCFIVCLQSIVLVLRVSLQTVLVLRVETPDPTLRWSTEVQELVQRINTVRCDFRCQFVSSVDTIASAAASVATVADPEAATVANTSADTVDTRAETVAVTVADTEADAVASPVAVTVPAHATATVACYGCATTSGDVSVLLLLLSCQCSWSVLTPMWGLFRGLCRADVPRFG